MFHGFKICGFENWSKCLGVLGSRGLQVLGSSGLGVLGSVELLDIRAFGRWLWLRTFLYSARPYLEWFYIRQPGSCLPGCLWMDQGLIFFAMASQKMREFSSSRLAKNERMAFGEA